MRENSQKIKKYNSFKRLYEEYSHLARIYNKFLNIKLNSQYMLSSKGIKIESYGRIPEKLLEAKIIGKGFSKRMRDMIGFRNRAIHNYPSLEGAFFYNVLQNDVEDFKKFLKVVEKVNIL